MITSYCLVEKWTVLFAWEAMRYEGFISIQYWLYGVLELPLRIHKATLLISYHIFVYLHGRCIGHRTIWFLQVYEYVIDPPYRKSIYTCVFLYIVFCQVAQTKSERDYNCVCKCPSNLVTTNLIVHFQNPLYSIFVNWYFPCDYLKCFSKTGWYFPVSFNQGNCHQAVSLQNYVVIRATFVPSNN